MALRALAGRLRGLVSRRAGASPSPAPDLEALDPAKLESSVEAKFQAVRKSIRDQERLRHEESEKRIRKDYRDAGIIVVTTAGIITFFWSSATEAFADALEAMEAKRMKTFAEGGKAMDAEEGKAMVAVEGKAMVAEEGKAKEG
ncbi:hypothetical protein EJB05_51610 [Eragrostis curvula]|uniref:Uncharacterized protein n=1 Tax=Eragrostis curvula TaxID=38414 RepID=A0A5J9SV69_9POAL|nr:hypothetical protein EJB05_51610 [Eragrostis curvula]